MKQRAVLGLPPVLLGLVLSGCYHIRFDVTGAPIVHDTRVVTPIADHVAPRREADAGCVDHPERFECQCLQQPHGVVDVAVSSNLAYAWLSVLTLGFVNVVDLEYACAPSVGSEPTQPPAPPATVTSGGEVVHAD
jgi:hypothetical protein